MVMTEENDDVALEGCRRQWKKGRSVTYTSLPKKDARDADTGFTVVDLNKNLA
jgi:hypothetical protein